MDLEKLKKLSELKKKGVLSQKEFEIEKAKLLGTEKEEPVYHKHQQNRSVNQENGVNFALGEFWKNYVGWGRACRSEFWFAVLFYGIIPYFVMSIFALILSAIFDEDLVFGVFYLTYALFSIVTAIPWFCLTVRRLHDSNKSAWNLCWILLPIAGPIILLVFLCQIGDLQDNRFGKTCIPNNVTKISPRAGFC